MVGLEENVLDESSDEGAAGHKKVEQSWFDSFVDRHNISLDDQLKDEYSRFGHKPVVMEPTVTT